MDNFFEIIIYLFIIASLVSSFRKKKNKNEEKVNRSENTGQKPQTTVRAESKREQSGKDILEEIQNLFNPPITKTSEQNTGFEDLWKSDSTQNHYKEISYNSPIPTEHEVTTTEHRETLSEHVFSHYDQVRLPEQTVVNKLLDDLDDQKENYKTRKPNELLMLIRGELSNRQTLKNYIVVSEILGKPKALRG
ncbi:MAG: hypothetical protein CO128_09480 [Ignavibacteriales bacterium CG_4_9_14_3_um_filter_30_11]|nr:MAG: hypothetical protein CO128_09480 [Ignavibacteriales bacterium CG_4_9_14_3_um_filter_30_11]